MGEFSCFFGVLDFDCFVGWIAWFEGFIRIFDKNEDTDTSPHEPAAVSLATMAYIR